METFQMFARLTKYDEGTGVFEAVAGDESIDKARERMHYDSSKPNFIKWSEDIAKATDGKSVGNVRAMHGRTAAGILTALECDDEHKQIRVKGRIVDPAEMAKMAAGVYTGVSVGGSYAKKWPDKGNPGVNWYTALPGEISVVDNPCNGNAHFTMIKADGMTVEKEFVFGDAAKALIEQLEKSAASASTDDATHANSSQVGEAAAADPEKDAVNEIAKAIDADDIKPTEVLALIKADAETRKRAKHEARCAELTAALAKDGLTNGEVEALAAKFGVTGDDPLAKLHELAKREFTQEERDKAADKGQALPDGSYPIKTTGDLKNAIQAFGRAKDKAAVKKHIIERAKALGATDELPADWKDSDKAFAIDTAFADFDVLAKDMGVVAWLARILADLTMLRSSTVYEAATEGDGSPIPGRLKMACDELGMILVEMTEEETSELADAEKAAFTGGLEKIGARHSKADADRLQAIHDHAVGMGATCAAEKIASDRLAKVFSVDAEGLEKQITTWRDKAAKWDAAPAAPKGVIRATRANDALPQDDPSRQPEAQEIADMAKSNDPNMVQRARELTLLRALESGNQAELAKFSPEELMKFEHKYGAHRFPVLAK